MNVLITGASGGIGKALALEFARAGYGIALHCFSHPEAAEKTAREIRALGGRAEVFTADITSEEQVERLFTEAEKSLGFIDTLINNAGIAHKGLFTDMSLDEWNKIFAVNCTGVFLCCRRALLPMIKEKRGSIVNISSMWGQQGASCEAAYSASKAAIIGLTQALAREEGLSGIRVNCVAPGVIDTPMNANLSPEDIEALKEETPLNRIGTPEAVAHAVRMISENEFITGQTLGVNGGMVM